MDAGLSTFTLGGRLNVPLTSRLSVLGALGGGAGEFHYPVIVNGAAISNKTWHGVMESSVALDIRIIRHLSLRIEGRNLVSGNGLSGSNSPDHFVALGGIAWHN